MGARESLNRRKKNGDFSSPFFFRLFRLPLVPNNCPWVGRNAEMKDIVKHIYWFGLRSILSFISVRNCNCYVYENVVLVDVSACLKNKLIVKTT